MSLWNSGVRKIRERAKAIAPYVMYFVVIFAFVVITVNAVDSLVRSFHVTEGYVVAKSCNEGDPWRIEWRFGDYAFVKYNDNPERYSIKVQNGSKSEWWNISESMYDAIEVGNYVIK